MQKWRSTLTLSRQGNTFRRITPQSSENCAAVEVRKPDFSVMTAFGQEPTPNAQRYLELWSHLLFGGHRDVEIGCVTAAPSSGAASIYGRSENADGTAVDPATRRLSSSWSDPALGGWSASIHCSCRDADGNAVAEATGSCSSGRNDPARSSELRLVFPTRLQQRLCLRQHIGECGHVQCAET
jgi:hypothetical protein